MKAIQICFLVCSLLVLPSLSQLITMPLTKATNDLQTPSTAVNFIATTSTSSLGNFKGLYKTGIQVGSESTQFSVVIDTASSYLWIPDSSTTASVSQKFDCSKSNTCKPNTADSNTFYYSAGSITGYSATDKINLQGSQESSISQFKFFLAKDISANLTSYNGILGLGLRNSNQTNPTFLEALKSNNLIKEAVFSLYLGGSSAFQDGGFAGDVTFGGYNPTYINNPFQFAPLIDNPNTPYWTLSLAGIGYGLTKNLTGINNLPVRIDSGSTSIFLPKVLIQNFVEVSGLTFKYDSDRGQYSCSCTTSKPIPDLVLYFNGVKVNISSSVFITPASANSYVCYLNMKGLPGDASLSQPAIIGSAIFKDYYTFFSAENKTVGFSQIKKSSSLSVGTVVAVILLGALIIAVAVYYCTKEKGVTVEGGGNYSELKNHGKGVAIGGGNSSSNAARAYYLRNEDNQSM